MYYHLNLFLNNLQSHWLTDLWSDFKFETLKHVWNSGEIKFWYFFLRCSNWNLKWRNIKCILYISHLLFVLSTIMIDCLNSSMKQAVSISLAEIMMQITPKFLHLVYLFSVLLTKQFVITSKRGIIQDELNFHTPVW